MSQVKQFLTEVVKTRASQENWNWFTKAVQLAEKSGKPNHRFLASYTAASRKLGKQGLLLDETEKRRLDSFDLLLPLDHWGIDEAARAVLLLSISHLPPDLYVELVLECYEFGDAREQQSWLRSLILLPHPERFLATAIDACRTNIIPLFEAIACENPYPAQYFPELNFNQMVLKSLFNEISLSRIVELESRFNPELTRMADDYVNEREIARRTVPEDIWLVIAPHANAEQRSRIFHYLHHENPEHRYWAARALGYAAGSETRQELERRRAAETEPRVLEAIEGTLGKMRARA